MTKYNQKVRKRLERALRLEPKVVGLMEDEHGRCFRRFLVPSEATDTNYAVDIRPDSPLVGRCDCKDFEHGNAFIHENERQYRVCKHVLAVLREIGVVNEEPKMWFDFVAEQAQETLAKIATEDDTTEEAEEAVRDGTYWLNHYTKELVEFAYAIVNSRYAWAEDAQERRADAVVEMAQVLKQFTGQYNGETKDSVGHLLYYLACQLAGRIRKGAIGAQKLALREISPRAVSLPGTVRDNLLDTMGILAETQGYQIGKFRRLEDSIILSTEEVAAELLETQAVRDAVVEYFNLKADAEGIVPLCILMPCLQYLLEVVDLGDEKAEYFVTHSLDRGPFVRSDEVREITITRTKSDGTVTEEHLSADILAKQVSEASRGGTWAASPKREQVKRTEEEMDDLVAELYQREIPALDEQYVEALMRYTYWGTIRVQQNELQRELPRLRHTSGDYYLYNVSLDGDILPDDKKIIYIGRGRNGKGHLLNTKIGKRGWLGNPFPVSGGTSRKASIEKFERSFNARLSKDEKFVKALSKLRKMIAEDEAVLACHCSPKPCHGDVILSQLFPEIYGEFVEHRDNAPELAPLDMGVLIGALKQEASERRGPYGNLANGIEYVFTIIPPKHREAALIELVGLLDQYGAGVVVSWAPEDVEVELIRLVQRPLARALDIKLDKTEVEPDRHELRRKVLSWIDSLVADRAFRMYPSQAAAVKAAVKGANTHEVKAVQRSFFEDTVEETKEQVERDIEARQAEATPQTDERLEDAAFAMGAVRAEEGEAYLGW